MRDYTIICYDAGYKRLTETMNRDQSYNVTDWIHSPAKLIYCDIPNFSTITPKRLRCFFLHFSVSYVGQTSKPLLYPLLRQDLALPTVRETLQKRLQLQKTHGFYFICLSFIGTTAFSFLRLIYIGEVCTLKRQRHRHAILPFLLGHLGWHNEERR